MVNVKFMCLLLGDSFDEETHMLDVEMDRPTTMDDTLIPRKKKTTYALLLFVF